jgi:hypothetical protein
MREAVDSSTTWPRCSLESLDSIASYYPLYTHHDNSCPRKGRLRLLIWIGSTTSIYIYTSSLLDESAESGPHQQTSFHTHVFKQVSIHITNFLSQPNSTNVCQHYGIKNRRS